jgi:aspartate/glutamate racemase
MHVGLIVGIGPAATDLYYRSLITTLAARGVVVRDHESEPPARTVP